MKKFTAYLVLLFLLSASNLFAANIASKSSGGLWSDATTWVGGVVPGSADDVTINGTVYAYNSSCNHLTISSGSALLNRDGYSVTISIHGNLSNTGTIANNTSGTLYVDVHGDLYNAGVFKPYELDFRGENNHEISQSINKNIEASRVYVDKAKDTLIFKSSVTFIKSVVRGYNAKGHFKTNGYDLRLDSCNLYNLFIYGNGTFYSSSTMVDAVSFMNKPKLDGKWNMYSGVIFEDNVTNLGILQNRPGYSVTLTVRGDFSNEGTVYTSPDGGTFYFDMYGDHFHNAGLFKVYELDFRGDSKHTLSHHSGNPIEAERTYLNNSLDSLYLASNVQFAKSEFRGYNQKGNVVTNGFNLRIDSARIFRLNIFSSDTLLSLGASADDVNFFGSTTFYGDWNMYYNVVIEEDAVNLGIMQNLAAYSVTLTVNGDFTNKGTVCNHPDGGTFYFNMFGRHLHNAGFFGCYELDFRGENTHALSQEVNTPIETSHTYLDKNLDSLYLESSVQFLKSEFRGYAERGNVITNGHNLRIDSARMFNLNVFSSDTLNSQYASAHIVSFFGQTKLVGDWNTYHEVVFEGDVTNIGTLQNLAGYSVTVTANGNFVNQGTVQTHEDGGTFYFNMLGRKLHNEGIFAPYELDFRGNTTHELSQAQAKPLESPYIYLDLSQDSLIFNSDIHFIKSHFRGYNQKGNVNTNGYNLRIDSARIYNLNIFSNDTLVSDNASAHAISLFGKTKLVGDWNTYHDVVFEDSVTNLGILQNLVGYSVGLRANGDFNNLGTVQTNPDGGTFYINMFGEHLHNEGAFKPYELALRGENLHYISHTPDAPFEAEKHYLVDAGDSLVLLSDVHFIKGEVRGYNSWAALNTNGFNLQVDSTWFSRLNVYGGDTITFGDAFLHLLRFADQAVLDGKTNLYDNVTFDDGLINQGILQNRSGYSVSSFVNGALENNGNILTSGGSLTLHLQKGLINDGSYAPTNTYLTGKADRSITTIAQPLLEGRYYVADTFKLLGESYLPHLQVNSNGFLTVDSDASLAVHDYSNSNADNSINNLNRINVKKPVDNYYDRYYRAVAYFSNYSEMGEMEVESYGNQQHPSTEFALPMWWRFKPDSVAKLSQFSRLELNYDPAYLAGLEEDSIRVFFSPNAGVDWSEVIEGKSIDTSRNIITLNNAGAYGHYVISSSDLGIVSFEPVIQRAEPKVFGDKGSVTVYGFGLGFTNDMTVYLTNGSNTIYADSSYITDPLGESFLAQFNVDLADKGKYSMVVQVPGYPDITLDDYFTIEEAERPDPWVALSGRNRFLVNRFQTFRINLGNRANMDALAVPLFFMVNDIPGMEVEFPDFNIGVQKSFTDAGWTQYRDTTIELYYVSDSFEGHVGTRMRLYPFIVPGISALSAENVRVRIKVPQQADLNMSVWITDPLVEGMPELLKTGTPPEVAACLAAAASKYYWDKAIGFIPGYDCYKLAYKVGETAVGEIIKDPNEKPKKSTWFSWVNSAWGWTWSVVDCAGDIIPVGKGVKIAKDLIDIAFETKSNYDAHQECWAKFKKRKKGKLTSKGVFSFDPNEIVGPTGYGPDGYIDPTTNMVYTVFFENKDSATAPASEVVVLDTLDKTLFDFSTFSFQDVVISDSTYEIQSFAQEFRVLLDMAPRINTMVQVTGTLDTGTGEIKVQYIALDRSTLELQEDVDLGFLPPNKTKPEGEGNFSYSIALKEGLSHDTRIENKALIFFDANKPIKTNVHYNTIDVEPPSSMVNMLPLEVTDSAFLVSWSGSDQGAGIENYTIMVSANDSDYTVWKSGTSLTSDTFYGRNKTTYKFYSIATDSLQLSERLRDEADATVYVNVKTGSVKEEKDNPILVYQSGNGLSVKTPENGEFLLYDMQGKLIIKHELNGGINLISSSHLSAQAYLVVIVSDSATYRKKIILTP
jgi:hypothetical protein